MHHIYAVPTHRPMSVQNVADYFSEVDFANKTFHNDCILLFFEDTEEYLNLQTIEKTAASFQDVKYMYINRNDTRYIYDLICRQLTKKAKSIFKKLYPNKNVNYGNVFNRIFLFAILLNADFIYRRDSDVLIEETSTGKKIYPVEIEMSNLGKVNNNKTIYVCGGGYKEKYDLDIESLIRDNGKDYSVVRKLFSCMSIPEEHHDSIIEEEILNNNIPFEEDMIDYDSRAYPECGNIAIFRLHRYFPSPCQDFILGSDYFFIDVSVHAKLNVVYHNRAVIHRHTQERKKEYNKVYNYWKGFLMLIDSQVYYREFYEKYLDNRDFNNFESNLNIIGDLTCWMKEHFEEFKLNRYDKRVNMYERTLKVLSESEDEQILMAVKELPREMNLIMEETEKSVLEHIELIENWKKIINTAEHIAQEAEVKKFLLEKIKGGKI